MKIAAIEVGGKVSMDLVGAEGFEPSTSWSRTMKPLRISILAVGARVALDSHTLLVSNGLRHTETGTLATAINASMWGVGTVLGTAERNPATVVASEEL